MEFIEIIVHITLYQCTYLPTLMDDNQINCIVSNSTVSLSLDLTLVICHSPYASSPFTVHTSQVSNHSVSRELCLFHWSYETYSDRWEENGIDRAYICEKVYEQDSDEWGVLYHFVSLPISVKISHDD
jgi:hypothetical protein